MKNLTCLTILSKNKTGFTLVELSIVLVIIGLLISGVLVGQSLIESAKINAFVKFVQQADIAVSQFKEKYKTLPGDSKFFTTPGDGDGVLETLSVNEGSTSYHGYLDYETVNFWRHLSQAGFKPDGIVYDNNVNTGIISGSDIPFDKNSDKKGSGVVIDIVPEWKTSRFYYFGDYSKTTSKLYSTTASGATSYKPKTVLAIDKKLDDGIPRIADMTNYDGIVSTHADSTSGRNCFDLVTYRYKVELDSLECRIRVKILGIAGN